MKNINYLRLVIGLILYTVIFYCIYLLLKNLLPLFFVSSTFFDIFYFTLWLIGYPILLFAWMKFIQKRQKIGIDSGKPLIMIIWKRLELTTKISFILAIVFALIGFIYLFNKLFGISFLFFIISLILWLYSIWKLYKLKLRKKKK